MNEVTLNKGNCLIYSIWFWLHNPSARIVAKWNKKRNLPTFMAKLNGYTFIYKPANNDKQFKFIFKGKVIKIKEKFVHFNK